MPNRYLKDSILTSEAVNSLSPKAELFYRRLMSVVDDFGRFDGRDSVIRTACYPIKVDSVKEQEVHEFKDECLRLGLISYYEINGKSFIVLLKSEQPRAQKSKYPQPPEGVKCWRLVSEKKHDETPIWSAYEDNGRNMQTYACKCEHMPTPALVPVPVPVPDLRINPPTPSKGFEEFWNVYPSKVGKQAAEKAWRRSKTRPELQVILDAIARQKRGPKWTKDNGQYIPNPATWINQGRWDDQDEGIRPRTIQYTPAEPIHGIDPRSLDEIIEADKRMETERNGTCQNH